MTKSTGTYGRTIREAGAPLFALVVILVTWEAACRFLRISEFLLPAPSAIGNALVEGFANGQIPRNLVVTLQETLAGYLLAVVLGIGLGSLVSEVAWIRRSIFPLLVALQTVPKIAIAPLLVVWFGFGMTSKIVIAAMVAFFPILINTIEGLSGTDPGRVDMLRSVCASRWQVFRMVKFPSALPFIFAGLGAGTVLALLGAVVGEFVGAQAGLGNLIMTVNFRMDIASVFAILVVLGVVGYMLHFALVLIQRRVVFWAKPVRHGGEAE